MATTKKLHIRKFSPNGNLTNQYALNFKAATADELKLLGEDLPEGYIAGWASTPTLDTGDDIVVPGAFSESIASRGLKGMRGVKLLLNHDTSKMAGTISKLETRGNGLWMEAQLNLNVSYVRDAYELAKMNGGIGFSVGFRVLERQWVKDAKTNDEYRIINKGDLMEISVVAAAMNEECGTVIIKGHEDQGGQDQGEQDQDEQDQDQEDFLSVVPKTLAEFERALVDAGFANTHKRANKVTSFVKSCAALFAAEIEEAKPSVTPEVAFKNADFDAVSKLIADMKKSIRL
jgi:HK97 family phage prohead protease